MDKKLFFSGNKEKHNPKNNFDSYIKGNYITFNTENFYKKF